MSQINLMIENSSDILITFSQIMLTFWLEQWNFPQYHQTPTTMIYYKSRNEIVRNQWWNRYEFLILLEFMLSFLCKVCIIQINKIAWDFFRYYCDNFCVCRNTFSSMHCNRWTIFIQILLLNCTVVVLIQSISHHSTFSFGM